MKITRVQLTNGAAVTPIPATIPAKFAKIEEDSTLPMKGLIAQIIQPDGTFSDEVSYPAGVAIVVHRSTSILARPQNYSAQGVPATGEPFAKVRASDASAPFVRVTEHEVLPRGNY